MNTDPRFVRSRSRLHEAVLELAAELPLSKITVTALATRAEVHRSTVYDHASSPTEILRQALYVELDELRGRFIVDESGSVTELVQGVITHLERHRAIYRRMNDEDGAQIREILSTHFQTSLGMLIRRERMTFPDLNLTLTQQEIARVATQALCDTHVGVFAWWLNMPEPRDPQVALSLMELVVPRWWDWQ